jgi:hypothetical protein
MALMLAGCATATDLFSGDATWFPKGSGLFNSPDLVQAAPSTVNVTRPIAPDDLVDQSGYCSGNAPQPAAVAAAPPAAATPQPPAAPAAPASSDGPMVLTPNASPPPSQAATVASTDPAIGSPTAPAPAATAAPPVAGGIALDMTECQVVRRAGHPESLQISTDVHGERNVVLTYIHGERPGIYHFVAGRLKVIERAPEPPQQPKVKKKRRSRRRA